MPGLTIRLTDADHKRLADAAASERMSMANYLLRLLDRELQSNAAKPAAHAGPRLNKREQAFEEYHDLMDNLPGIWTDADFDRVRSTIVGLRIAGGNISHAEMPLPADAVAWKNDQQTPGFSQFAGNTHEQLLDMLADYDMRGEEPPAAFMVAYRASKPAVPE